VFKKTCKGGQFHLQMFPCFIGKFDQPFDVLWTKFVSVYIAINMMKAAQLSHSRASLNLKSPPGEFLASTLSFAAAEVHALFHCAVNHRRSFLQSGQRCAHAGIETIWFSARLIISFGSFFQRALSA
jgi:hypothetical protein